MSELIDAKGLGCAEPVILAKNALDLCDEVTIVVDGQMALENLKLLGAHTGCAVDVTGEPGDVFSIRLSKTEPDGKRLNMGSD
jgi:TusA-related sulfurtransferase